MVTVTAHIPKPVESTYTIEMDERTARAILAMVGATGCSSFHGIADIYTQLKPLLSHTQPVVLDCTGGYPRLPILE